MTADDLFAALEEQHGRYPDCGVVCTNGRPIRRVVCEVEWHLLYHAMSDPQALYVVHHPVSDYALAFCEVNDDEDEDDVRSEAETWLLEFKARELGMNLAVVHTMADKMLERALAAELEGVRGPAIPHRIDDFFRRYFDPHPAIVVLPKARRRLAKRASARVVLGTYGYPLEKGVVYVDESGMEETRRAITIPHSLVDATALKIWRSSAEALLKQGKGGPRSAGARPKRKASR